jgi:hypothetical protein
MEKIWSVIPLSFFIKLNVGDIYSKILNIGADVIWGFIRYLRENGQTELADALQALDDAGNAK